MPRSSDCLQRSLAPPDSAFIFRLLPRVKNAFIAEQGRSRFPARASGETGQRHCHSAGWWAASPIRTSRCLNFAPAPSRSAGDPCGRLAFFAGSEPIQPLPGQRIHFHKSPISSPSPRHSARYEFSDSHNGQISLRAHQSWKFLGTVTEFILFIWRIAGPMNSKQNSNTAMDTCSSSSNLWC